MNRRLISLTLAVLPLALVSGCEANLHGTINSSQGDNDYYEEPISEYAKKYSAALVTSNKFVELLSEGRLVDAHGLFHPRLKEVVSEEQFRSLYDAQVLEKFGSIIEYKPMQWGFTVHSKLENVVVSTKIVIHENSEAFYTLNFEDNGIYDHIIGFNITPRSGGERVVQGANRAHGMR